MSYKEDVFNLSQRMRAISLDNSNIYLQARYGPSKIVKLPLNLNESLSCFSAVIIGDGHLSKHKFKTSVECTNKQLLDVLSQIIFNLFNIKTSIKKVKKTGNKKKSYHLTIYSKAVQELLSIVLEIPRGKKSGIVKIPGYVQKSSKKIKGAFVIGLLAAEGSRKGNSRVRICSASKGLLLDTKKVLKDMIIESSLESWINKKYKKRYYSLSFKRIDLDSLMRGCRSGQTGQILSIFQKVIEDHA